MRSEENPQRASNQAVIACIYLTRKPGVHVMSTDSSGVVVGSGLLTSPAFTVDEQGNISPASEVDLVPEQEFFIQAPPSSTGFSGYICLWQGECKCSAFIENLSTGQYHMAI